MASETFGKKILRKYNYCGGPLGLRKKGITKPLFELPGYFNGHKITILKAIFTERDYERWTLIKNLTESIESSKSTGQTFFFPSGLTIAKLHLSK